MKIQVFFLGKEQKNTRPDLTYIGYNIAHGDPESPDLTGARTGQDLDLSTLSW